MSFHRLLQYVAHDIVKAFLQHYAAISNCTAIFNFYQVEGTFLPQNKMDQCDLFFSTLLEGSIISYCNIV